MFNICLLLLYLSIMIARVSLLIVFIPSDPHLTEIFLINLTHKCYINSRGLPNGFGLDSLVWTLNNCLQSNENSSQ